MHILVDWLYFHWFGLGSMMNRMKESDIQPTRRRVPRWVVRLIVIGVPAVVTVVGLLTGAHVVEIVVFSMLCLFSMALVFFYALG